jgi:hypothetical protein
MRHAIARAVSRLDLESTIENMLNSVKADERGAACVLCAFRDIGEPVRHKIRELLLDPDQEVTRAALWSLRHIRHTQYTASLAAAFSATDCAREWRWILLDALLVLGDLGDEKQALPAWLQQDPPLPTDMWDYAIAEVKKRRKATVDHLKRQDQP